MLSGLVGLFALFVVLELKIGGRAEGAESSPKPRPKWEYKAMECYDEEKLAKAGDEGWEMVAVVGTISKWDFNFHTPTDYTGGNSLKLSESTGASGEMKGYGGCSMYFKRLK
jgi:hypothetical protein